MFKGLSKALFTVNFRNKGLFSSNTSSETETVKCILNRPHTKDNVKECERELKKAHSSALLRRGNKGD